MPRSRSFPEICGHCGQRGLNPVRVNHTVAAKHDGTEYIIAVPDLAVEQCSSCGNVFFGNEADDQISRVLRDQLHLLQPEQIKDCRNWLDLTQEHIAAEIGAAAESLSRWENGRILQSRGTDRFLRAYFALPELRSFLRSLDSEPSLGSRAYRTIFERGAASEWLPTPVAHEVPQGTKRASGAHAESLAA
jgi:DNA-binding transcriptional regulator YiaG